jgi:hypothetical protein
MSLTKNKIIQEFVSKNIHTHENKFDCLIQDIEKYIEGAVAHNMSELKEKANDKKKKGDLFECFCFLYLQHVLNHDQVWFYKDFPMELKNKFHLTKNDYGIDLLSKKGDDYYAIQCKYKKPQDKIQIVSWRSLSTFYAIVVKTGPWLKHITMTNVNGCKHIGKKGEKDWSICLGTFRNIDHFNWLKISENTEPVLEPILEPVLEPSIKIPITKSKKKYSLIIPDKDVLRNIRLQYYGKGLQGTEASLPNEFDHESSSSL